MCKTQRDIVVVQQDKRKKNKKMRDTMKAFHNQAGCQPPRSPILPSPPEVEIAYVDDRVNAFLNFDLYNQYGSNFGSDIGASSSSAPPPPPLLVLILCLKVALLTRLHGFLLHRLMSGQHVSHMNSLISLPLPMLQIRAPEVTLGISGSGSDLAATFPSPGPLWMFDDKGGEEMD
jgi:hypothetical protein